MFSLFDSGHFSTPQILLMYNCMWSEKSAKLMKLFFLYLQTESSSQESTSTAPSEPKPSTPFDDAFDEEFDPKPVTRPPLVRRKTAPNTNPAMDEPDHITKVKITREHKPVCTLCQIVCLQGISLQLWFSIEDPCKCSILSTQENVQKQCNLKIS